MEREFGSGLRLEQLRSFFESGRWEWQVNCWPDGDKWVLAVSPRGNRSIPYHVLIAEKSGLPRRMSADTALDVAASLSGGGVYFNRQQFQSLARNAIPVDKGCAVGDNIGTI